LYSVLHNRHILAVYLRIDPGYVLYLRIGTSYVKHPRISANYVLSFKIDAGYALQLITATSFAMYIRVFVGSAGLRYNYVATLYKITMTQ